MAGVSAPMPPDIRALGARDAVSAPRSDRPHHPVRPVVARDHRPDRHDAPRPRARDLQAVTGGFAAVACWPFWDAAA